MLDNPAGLIGTLWLIGTCALGHAVVLAGATLLVRYLWRRFLVLWKQLDPRTVNE